MNNYLCTVLCNYICAHVQLQYYDLELYPSMKEQKNFEMNVFNKTHKADSKFII